MRVNVGSARSWPTRPAEWKVEPLVNSARSSTTTSRSPSSLRWNATLAPPTPPPITTIRAVDGSSRPAATTRHLAGARSSRQATRRRKGL